VFASVVVVVSGVVETVVGVLVTVSRMAGEEVAVIGADSGVVVTTGSSAAKAASGTDWAMSKRLSTAIPIRLNIYVRR
jgi:hypothetical protein